MLHFISGTDNNRKKEYIFNELYELAEQNKRAYLIVPEQSSFERDREFLFRYGEVISNRITVTGITQLSRAILEENGLKTKPDADEAARNVLMSLAVEEVSDSLEVYGKYKSKSGPVSELLTEYAEIKQAGFRPEDLGTVSAMLKKGTLKTKTDELSRIFSAYEALVTERFSESTDNINIVVDFLSKNNYFDSSVIYFYDYRGFTGMQIKLLQRMMAQAENVFVAVNTPSAVNAAYTEAFDHVLRTAKELRKAAAYENVAVCEMNTDEDGENDEFSVLRSSLFSYEDDSFEGETEKITLIEADNKYNEAEQVAIEIRRLLREENYRCREIAVVERGSGYSAVLNSALHKYGIPVFEDKRSALSDYPLIRAVLAAVKICVYGFVTEDILSLIKTGIIGIADEDCSELENYVYIWQTERGGWLKEFTENPSGYGEEIKEDDRKKLEKLNTVRKAVIEPLIKLKKKLEKGSDGCRAVFEYLTEVKAGDNFCEYAKYLNENENPDEAMQCSKVWDTVMESLDALNETIAGRPITPARFYELLNIILTAGDVGGIPAGIDEIVTGTADRTRYSGIKALFVLGANEGVFPKNTVTGGLFTSRERRLLKENNFVLENLTENIYAEERYIAYLTLTAPTEKLYVSYSSGSITGEVMRPSGIVKAIEKLFPGCRRIRTQDTSPTEKVGSPETAFEQYASLYQDNDIFKASLGEYLNSTGLYAGRIASLDRAAKKNADRIENGENAMQLFGKDMYVSPSKAETYNKCPFMYFCRYGMKVEKIQTAGLDVRINGLMVHAILEKMLDPGRGKKIADESEEELRADMDEIAEQYITDFMGGRAGKSKSFNKSLDKVKQTAFDILLRLVQEFGETLFETRDVELQIGEGEKAKVAPYKIDLPDGGSITIAGTVDRVDVYDNDGKAYLRVIDYKTGGKDFRLSEVFEGLNMQMLIYLMCLWDNAKDLYGDIVPAGILYVPAKTGGIEKAGRNASDEEINKAKLKNGRMNGMILDDMDVLNAMDPAGNQKFIKAGVYKNGNKFGNFLSLNNFIKLHKMIDEKLSETALALHGGKIAAMPVVDDKHPHTCEYCDYRNVCLREDDDASKELTELKHEDAVKKLEEVFE